MILEMATVQRYGANVVALAGWGQLVARRELVRLRMRTIRSV